jgi:hypothetical protein
LKLNTCTNLSFINADLDLIRGLFFLLQSFKSVLLAHP